MTKDHGSSVKNDKQYEGLRKKGMSKGRAAAIANPARVIEPRRQEVAFRWSFNHFQQSRRNQGPESRGRAQGRQKVQLAPRPAPNKKDVLGIT
jgi:hypothetical protein